MNAKVNDEQNVPQTMDYVRAHLLYASDRVGALRAVLEELGLAQKDCIPWIISDLDRSIRAMRHELDADPIDPDRHAPEPESESGGVQ